MKMDNVNVETGRPMKADRSGTSKKAYKKPNLVEWGSLLELTQGPNFVKTGDVPFGGTGGV